MSSAADFAIRSRPLSYQDRLEKRSSDAINLIVIHCTELPSLSLAREFGERIQHEDSKTGNSGHYYVDRDGRIEEYISPTFVAHHVIGHNQNSIGIELVNNGRYPDWFNSDAQELSDPYPDAQIRALINLIKYLENDYPALDTIAGHEDLDETLIVAEDDPSKRIKRKVDPGPLFPWTNVLSEVSLKRKVPN